MSEESHGHNNTFADVIGLLNRRKWIILGVTLAGSVGVFLYALISILLPKDKSYLPNYYIPEAQVIINESSEGGLTDLLKSSGLGNLAGLAGVGSSGPTASGLAMKIARTDSFLDSIAQEFDFYTRFDLTKSEFPKTMARQMIRSSLQFRSDADSGMMAIGYKSTDKVLATDIVNYVVRLLEEEFRRISVDKNVTQAELIARKLSGVEAEIERLQGELNGLQQQYNTFDLAALAREQASKLASLRADLLQKSLEIDSYNRAVGIEDPALRRLKVERDTLKANIDKLEKGYRENGIVVPAERELPDLVIRYTKLRGDLDVQRKIYETLVQQQELVKLQVEGVPPTFQIYETAVVPEMKAGPSRPRLCMIVAGASFFFSIALAFLVDYFVRMLKDPKNVRKVKGIIDEG
jgi:tyrosine-protein kinase Etk/Wzc